MAEEAKYTLTSYEPVVIELKKPEVPPELVERQIKLDLEPYATQSDCPPERELMMEDTAYITVTDALIDGEPAKNLNLNNVLMHIGSGIMPEAFDEQVCGMKAGETRAIAVSAAVPGAPASASMKITMTATVNRIVEFDYPELTDAFVEAHFEPLKTVGQFRKAVENQFTIPDMPKNDPRFLHMILRKLAERLETLPSSTQLKPKQTLEDLEEACAIGALADHMNLELTEEEAVAQLPGNTPEERRQSQESFIEHGIPDEMYNYARRCLAMKWLIDNSRITYV